MRTTDSDLDLACKALRPAIEAVREARQRLDRARADRACTDIDPFVRAVAASLDALGRAAFLGLAALVAPVQEVRCRWRCAGCTEVATLMIELDGKYFVDQVSRFPVCASCAAVHDGTRGWHKALRVDPLDPSTSATEAAAPTIDQAREAYDRLRAWGMVSLQLEPAVRTGDFDADFASVSMTEEEAVATLSCARRIAATDARRSDVGKGTS